MSNANNALVLVVDDEPEILRVYSRLLRRTEIRFVTTQCAEEALAIVAREPVAVLIYDQCMPVIRGDELAARVHAARPDTLLILSTGAHDGDDPGLNFRVLVKPWPGAKMLDAIREALTLHAFIDGNDHAKQAA
jgi:DNA-binding NtrC family response regulator